MNKLLFSTITIGAVLLGIAQASYASTITLKIINESKYEYTLRASDIDRSWSIKDLNKNASQPCSTLPMTGAGTFACQLTIEGSNAGGVGKLGYSYSDATTNAYLEIQLALNAYGKFYPPTCTTQGGVKCTVGGSAPDFTITVKPAV